MNLNDATMDHWQRNDTYRKRMPSPPRIPLSPPSERASDIIIVRARENPWHSTLLSYDWNLYAKAPDPLQWRYADRRFAQLILPYLYLGPLTLAKDVEFLRCEGITMVLAILANTWQGLSGALRAAANYGVEVKTVSVLPSDPLIPVFDQISAMIDQHLTRRGQLDEHSVLPTLGKTLVVCESGNDRSAAVTAAHIIEMYHCNVAEAVHVVHQRRFSVNIDDGLRTQLLTYMELLQARKMVAIGEPTVNYTSSHKRSFDDSDDDMTFEEEGEEPGRRIFSPFSGALRE